MRWRKTNLWRRYSCYFLVVEVFKEKAITGISSFLIILVISLPSIVRFRTQYYKVFFSSFFSLFKRSYLLFCNRSSLFSIGCGLLLFPSFFFTVFIRKQNMEWDIGETCGFLICLLQVRKYTSEETKSICEGILNCISKEWFCWPSNDIIFFVLLSPLLASQKKLKLLVIVLFW